MSSSPVTHLSALQLADSAFPSGRYTLSHGLEPLVQSGAVPATIPALQQLLVDCLRLSAGPVDGTAVACAHSSYELAVAVDRRLTAVKLTTEARNGSIRTGKALLDTARTFVDDPELDAYAALVRDGATAGHHAVVLGLLSASIGLTAQEAVAGELYAFAANFTSAAVRLGLADHQVAQRILHGSRTALAEVADQATQEAGRRGVSSVAGYTPALDLMSMRHEVAEVRLFAN
ncbi:urease accessory protein [Kribbella rubisoli]|uniref:Urease accessory protein UreF n=1 Tax=Kribbella rubisoli TaxID=3075929 RepID=A0A4Q7VYP0_9ACTN|nr:urease accessory UreF family protein [Kribbella rubisoli]RZU01877.1 urease accessory protein [Kribbella rubisoli]